MTNFEIGVCGEACVAFKFIGNDLASEWANDSKARDVKDVSYGELSVVHKNLIAKCIFAQRLGLCTSTVNESGEI